MKSFDITTTKNHKIAVSLFEPENSNGKLVLINSATGVKQQLYWRFSTYLSAFGYTVITYDYFGIGLSKPQNLKNCNASMKSWGSVDYNAITDFIIEKYPHFQKFCVGHSVGALILGMNPHSTIFKKFIFVATQKAHVSNLNLKTKVLAYLGFGFLQPFSTSILGYFPAPFLSLGERLPKKVSFDWRSLILHKKSTNKLLEKIPNYSSLLTQKTLLISAEDDSWVTNKGMKTLLKETFPNLQAQFYSLNPIDSPKKDIGHINFFRSYNENLWQITLEWLK